MPARILEFLTVSRRFLETVMDQGVCKLVEKDFPFLFLRSQRQKMRTHGDAPSAAGIRSERPAHSARDSNCWQLETGLVFREQCRNELVEFVGIGPFKAAFHTIVKRQLNRLLRGWEGLFLARAAWES